MRHAPGFTLVEILLVMVLGALLVAGVIAGRMKIVERTHRHVVEQHAAEFGRGVDGWVSRQPSLAAAIRSFSDAGDHYVPSATAFPDLVKDVNNFLAADIDQFTIDGDSVTSDALRRANAYLTLVWPKPYRTSKPLVEIHYNE